MEYLDPISVDPVENLSLDEALLDQCERSGREFLRVWEPAAHCIVAGRSNRRFEDIDRAACGRLGIPIIRRHSGGGTVLLGPGCLVYSVVISRGRSKELSSIRSTNRYAMERLKRALGAVTLVDAEIRGFTDLAISDRKFSGNAQYRGRKAILFHGTLLLALDLGLIDATLRMPPSAPDYRRGRPHCDFLMNLAESADKVTAAIVREWGATPVGDAESRRVVERLVGRAKSQTPGRARFDAESGSNQ